MWLAPVLVVTGQAFLLQVLTVGSLGGFARAMILSAGIAASIAALVTLLRGRAREVEYSEAIAYYSEEMGFPELRSDLPRKQPESRGSSWRRLDRRLGLKSLGRAVPPAPLPWAFALIVFIAADAAVYCTA
jgi:hypothetical protein